MLATELPSFYLSMGGKGGKKFGPRRGGRAVQSSSQGLTNLGSREGGRRGRLPPRRLPRRRLPPRRLPTRTMMTKSILVSPTHQLRRTPPMMPTLSWMNTTMMTTPSCKLPTRTMMTKSILVSPTHQLRRTQTMLSRSRPLRPRALAAAGGAAARFFATSATQNRSRDR